jgi:hypothetical protein
MRMPLWFAMAVGKGHVLMREILLFVDAEGRVMVYIVVALSTPRLFTCAGSMIQPFNHFVQAII